MNVFKINKYVRMGKRLTFSYKLSALVIIFYVIYNEHFMYTINSWKWSKLKCKNESDCLKILLVADPQLIGENNEILHFLTPVSIWDSDRFLKKTYSVVVDHLSPDIIIFLGDLFDEGSIATSAQHTRYLKRLFSIFTTEYPIIHIWLPGDNDIGGENADRVTEAKIKRFEESFSQSPVIDVHNIRFSKINRMIREQPKSFDIIRKKYKSQDQKLSIVISHMPLIFSPGSIVDKVIEILKPKIVFAAHEHKSRIVRTNVWQGYRKIDRIDADENQIFNYKIEKDEIIEFLVPPCSYRMGTDNIGYGAVIIDKAETMGYTVLWSPKRFTYLALYLILFGFIVCIIILEYICRKIFRPRIIFMSKQHFPYRIIKNGV